MRGAPWILPLAVLFAAAASPAQERDGTKNSLWGCWSSVTEGETVLCRFEADRMSRYVMGHLSTTPVKRYGKGAVVLFPLSKYLEMIEKMTGEKVDWKEKERS